MKSLYACLSVAVQHTWNNTYIIKFIIHVALYCIVRENVSVNDVALSTPDSQDWSNESEGIQEFCIHFYLIEMSYSIALSFP